MGNSEFSERESQQFERDFSMFTQVSNKEKYFELSWRVFSWMVVSNLVEFIFWCLNLWFDSNFSGELTCKSLPQGEFKYKFSLDWSSPNIDLGLESQNERDKTGNRKVF